MRKAVGLFRTMPISPLGMVQDDDTVKLQLDQGDHDLGHIFGTIIRIPFCEVRHECAYVAERISRIFSGLK